MKKIIISVSTFIILFLGYIWIVDFYYPVFIDEGRFQDLFSGVDAFFSALAFLGLIIAILLQREDLNLQRKELELTRNELMRSAEAQEKSERILSKQAESLKLTAKLNGLSSILQHTNSLIEVEALGKYGPSGVNLKHKENADKIINQINEIINSK